MTMEEIKALQQMRNQSGDEGAQPVPAPTQQAPTPALAPVQQPVNSQQKSAPVKLSQGATYNPTSQSGNQNSAGNPPATDNDNGSVPAGKSGTIIIIAVIVVILIIVGCVVAVKFKSRTTPQEIEEPIEIYDPDLDPYEPEVIPFSYSEQEIMRLREVGYTGDEIEEYQAIEAPVDELVARAEEMRQAWIDEAIAPLFDTASDEYKQNLSSTWLGLDERYDVADFETADYTVMVTKNLDYEKIPIRGNQIYVKVYIDDEHTDYIFIQVTPARYAQLKDSGNMIVTYSYQNPWVYNDEDGSSYLDETRMFITEAYEDAIYE